MVQRKAPSTKHGIPVLAVHPGGDKLLGNLKKKKSTSGHQDGKKMKRSGSIKKCSDFQKITEIQRQPMSRIPGKPPSLAGSAPATPQKPPPNYMKSTTSSEARKEKEKERSPVSKSLNLDKKICSNSKSTTAAFPASSSSSSSYSGFGNHKPSPARNSTSKKKTTVRALTKAPSFKKCSKMGICSEVRNLRRSTCSSTMKDSKFPPYLVLDDGGTEAEGTSVLKVCPYTYCSLNGHHHQPFPPLNCFLKAKRRSLKAQRSVKLRSLSPRKSAGPAAGEIVVSSDKSQDETDFFVEIYATSAESEGRMIDSSQEDSTLVEEQNLFDEIPYSEEQSDQFGGGSCGEEEQTERSFAGGIASMEEDEDDGQSSEATELQWEQGHDSASQVDVEGNFCSKGELCPEIKKPEIVELDDISSCCTEEVLDEELLRELFDEETEAATWCVTGEDGDSGGDTDELALEQADTFQEPEGEKRSVGEPIQIDCLGGTGNDALEANLQPQEAENDCPTETVAEFSNDQLQLRGGEPEKSGNNGLGVLESSIGVSEGDQDFQEMRILKSSDAEEDSETNKLRLIENGVEECYSAEGEDCVDKSSEAETLAAAAANEGKDAGNVGMSRWARNNSKQELEDPCSDWKWKIGCRRAMDEVEENEREFNPRDPNFLPLVPDPDAERVDLKHQTVDERKNSEEWMIDHALQQAVTKLASARRKRKVALLVEAFETVSPIPKYEPHSSPVFSATTPRAIQACS